jgi:predicted nucleotidyltransferase
MVDILKKIPSDFQEDLKTAIKILQSAGCTEIYIFGSIAHGEVRTDSDIDIAIKGCPKDIFFKLLGTLLITLNHSVDLIDLDSGTRFNDFLIKHEDLVRVA